jgi:PAS domain S-box-containing protein
MTLERIIFGGFGLALTILIAVALLSYDSAQQFIDTSRLVAHTQATLVEIETTLSLMRDAETGHRGYIITGDERYLEPYHAAVRLVPDQIKQLRSLILDSAQQRRLDRLEPLIAAHLQYRAEALRLQRAEGVEATRRYVMTGLGKRTMDALREATREMEDAEREQLSRRIAESEQRAHRTIVFSAVGGLLGVVVVVAAGVTVRRAIAERARVEDERRRFFALSRDLLCTSGFDGYFKELNPAWEATLGYTKDELLAKPYLDFVHPDDRASTMAEAQKISEGRTTLSFENRYCCKDGSCRWLLWTATPVPEDQLIYAATRDVTERKRAEEEIKKANEQLEAANKELEAFSYSVSHDLRAPLRHIDGFATLLQKHAAALDEKGRRHLATISESAKQMGRLIDDLLAFSCAGRAEMRLSTVALGRLVKEVQDTVAQEAEGRHITWTIHPLPDVQADPALLRQVLINLIANAVKYTRRRDPAVIEIGALSSPPSPPPSHDPLHQEEQRVPRGEGKQLPALALDEGEGRGRGMKLSSLSVTTARGSTSSMPTSCSASSSVCTARASSRARASAWPTSGASFNATRDGSWPRGRRARGRRSTFRSPGGRQVRQVGLT